MTFPRHDDAVRTSARRVSVTSVDDSGQTAAQQLVDAGGYDGDSPSKMVRVQGHGFHSNPPVGSEGVAIALGGRSDRLHVLGLDHQDYRPKNVAPGDTVVYNSKSPKLSFTGDDATLSADGTLTIQVKSVIIKCGGVSWTLDANGWRQTGGAIAHDEHDIGKTHQHVNSGGGGLGGPPQ